MKPASRNAECCSLREMQNAKCKMQNCVQEIRKYVFRGRRISSK